MNQYATPHRPEAGRPGRGRPRLAATLVALLAALALAVAAAGALGALPASAATPQGALAWGQNAFGQLGDGTTTDRLVPDLASGLNNLTVAVAAGAQHSLALLSDGTVRAWGSNGNGELGDGTTIQRLTPVPVMGLTGVRAVTAGANYSLALLSDGTVRAWGRNDSGQLGDGTTTERHTPVKVKSLTGVTAISAASGVGGASSLALLNDGTVRAWGHNSAGQLGDGTTTERFTAVKVKRLTKVKAISESTFHGLALLASGKVKAWGSNAFGQLGDGTTVPFRLTPVVVKGGLAGGKAISAGDSFSVALLKDGTVRTWGRGGDGELGNGVTTNQPLPVAVTGLSGVTAISAGEAHVLALLSAAQQLWAWGRNTSGQLGNNTTTNSAVPVQVQNLFSVTSVAAGIVHSLAVGFPPVS